MRRQKMSENIIKLKWGAIYNQENETLYCGHNEGFFSNCTTTLWNLTALYKQNITPRNINFSRDFSNYKTPEQNQNQVDMYPFYFNLCNSKEIKFRTFWIRHADQHYIYRFLDFGFYNQLIAKYFNLSQPILEMVDSLVEKYNVNPAKTIAVYYRGTDKYLECSLADPNLCLKQAEKILKRHPAFKILIQTDQKQVRDLFINYFGDRCLFFEELPVTEGREGMHKMDSNALGMNKFEYGKAILAVIYLISRCRFVINHSGNMAFWVCLFRGNAKNVDQFDANGDLVTNLSLIKHIFSRLIRRLSSTFFKV